MKIVVAPDSFKGSLTAKEVCDAVGNGIRRVFPDAEIIKTPMADGGEGTVETLVESTGGKLVEQKVKGPLGEEINACFGILGDGKTAVIEMARASGLPLVPVHKKNPLITTTYGTGELIKSALDLGCRKFIIGVGGSATNDGGVGMAQALGIRFLDKEGKEIGFGGGSLDKLEKIDMSGIDERIQLSTFLVASDVDNPLCGEKGASATYGPQKGATPEMVKTLDKNLAHLAEIIKRDLGKDIKDIPGAGAAGGLGAGLMAFCNAELRRGIDIIIEITHLENKMDEADLVITGEGQMDFQTIHGKTPYGVAKAAKKKGLPVAAIVGSIGEGAEVLYENGIDTIYSILEKPMSLEECIALADKLVERAAERLIRAININLFKGVELLETKSLCYKKNT
ncbi:MAG: glycerate 2-kinase [Thermosediminibacterales bacterium]|nr:glycerate 2-kinase [Thermosediminibacterales bacterium]